MAAAAAAATAVKPGTEALLGLSAYVDEDALSHAFPVKVVAVVELFMAPAFETNVAAVATGLLPVVCMFANRGNSHFYWFHLADLFLPLISKYHLKKRQDMRFS